MEFAGGGCGCRYVASPPTPDANWNVVALPQFFSGPQSPPYAAWIFTGGSAPSNIPGGWLGGSTNSGTSVNGVQYHWIGLRNNDATSLMLTGTENQYHSTIYATTFQASAAGTVPFSFDVSVDNRARVFINGTITGTNTDQPTIDGTGTQIGGLIWNNPPPPPDTGARAFSILQNVSGTASVLAGTDTLYVVVDDYITTGTTFGFTGLLVAPVPEPSTYLLAVMGMTIGGWHTLRRRWRRRPA